MIISYSDFQLLSAYDISFWPVRVVLSVVHPSEDAAALRVESDVPNNVASLNNAFEFLHHEVADVH